MICRWSLGFGTHPLKSCVVLATVVVQHVFPILVSQTLTELELVREKQCSFPLPLIFFAAYHLEIRIRFIFNCMEICNIFLPF